MIKKEVFSLLQSVQEIYPQFEITQNKVDLWTDIFRDYEQGEMLHSLKEYAKVDKYPPKPADLLKGKVEEKTHVPSLQETQDLLAKREKDVILAQHAPDVLAAKEKAVRDIAVKLGFKKRG